MGARDLRNRAIGLAALVAAYAVAVFLFIRVCN